MNRNNWIAAAVTVLSTCAAASSAETLLRLDWQDLAKAGRASIGEARATDGPEGAACLKIANEERRPFQQTVLVMDRPGITATQYALTGWVRTAGVQGHEGYLELLNHFTQGPFFTRALQADGPMRRLEGDSNWRRFMLPFLISDGRSERPHKLTLNLSLPGRGTVWIGPMELVEYARDENPLALAMGAATLSGGSAGNLTGAWWSDQTAGLAFGSIGAGIGLLGAMIGTLAGMGRARAVVMGFLWFMVVAGGISLALAGAALSQSQPYAVWYPLLLMGILCLTLPLSLRSVIRRRYEQLELRRIAAIDGV